MRNTIKLNRQGFTQEIETFSSNAKNFKNIRVNVSKAGSRMSGLNKLEECTREYNKVIMALNTLLERDIAAMHQMENQLVQTDNAVAAKTFKGGT